MSETQIRIPELLDQLEEIVLDGNRVPFTGSRLVKEDDALETMDDIRDQLPKEIKQASKIISQGMSYIDNSKKQAQQIISRAQAERNKLVDSTGVYKEAERQVAKNKS